MAIEQTCHRVWTTRPNLAAGIETFAPAPPVEEISSPTHGRISPVEEISRALLSCGRNLLLPHWFEQFMFVLMFICCVESLVHLLLLCLATLV